MDEATKGLLLQRREISRQMQATEPGSAEESALFEQEAEIVAKIKAADIDLSDPNTAYGIAYGVLPNG